MSVARRIVWLASVVFVLACVGAQWHRDSGFTSLIRFGHDLDARRLPAIDPHAIAIQSGAGYDGQYYASLAVALDPRTPELQRALDLPQYRARRILLPAIAHALGFGRPQAVLNVFALLNLAAWLVLAWRVWIYVAPLGSYGVAIWAACLLSLGALDSVRFSLTDLPAMLAILLAVEALTAGRKGRAAMWLAFGGLTRETTIFAATIFAPADRCTVRSWWRAAGLAALAALPLAAWALWLAWQLPPDYAGFAGNFDWPGFALTRHAVACVHAIAGGDFDGRYTFGLIAAAGMAYQSYFVLRRAREASAWVHVGVPFAILFWLLGDYVWHGYWAVARACLPLTFAYNFLLPRDRHFAWRFALGNACLLHALVRFVPG